MIELNLGVLEYYNEDSNEFVSRDFGIVRFEYSLKAIYDWEGTWLKPYIGSTLTDEEQFDFYLKMALDKVEPEALTHDILVILASYVSRQHTATTFTDDPQGQKGINRKSTSEEFYAMMLAAGIPLEFEYRNFNRLLTILRIHSNKNAPPKKMSKEDILRQNSELNKQRRAQLNTKG